MSSNDTKGGQDKDVGKEKEHKHEDDEDGVVHGMVGRPQLRDL